MRWTEASRYYVALAITAFICSLVYLSHLPWTVQMGDTGEVVANGYRLFVGHPPGYPLFTILIYGFTHIFEVGTVFWRAAFLNQFFSLATVLLCLYLLRRTPWLGMALALSLAFSRLFWKFTVLPDVFALNALIAALILTLYFEERLVKFRPFVSFLFMLGMAHHLTIVFLSPVVLHALWLDRKLARTWILGGAGVVIAVGLYVSMMSFNPHHFWSWGNVDSLKEVWRHFLREDYGTFKLVNSQETGSFDANIAHFINETLPSFLPLLAAMGGALWLRRGKMSAREWTVSGCLVAYVFIFFALSNMDLVGFRIETFERFFILPHVQLCFLAALWLGRAPLSRRTQAGLAALLLLGAGVNFWRFSPGNNFSKNTIAEDYALQLFAQAPTQGKPVTVWTITDTRYNAVKYIQTVLGIRTDVLSVHPTMLLFPWYAKKSMREGLVLRRFPLTRDQDLDADDFVADNVKKYTILSTFTLENSKRYHVTYLPVGLKLEEGSGVAFAEEARSWVKPVQIRKVTTPAKQYDVFREMWNEYGIYYFKKADQLFKQRRVGEAKAELLKALELVPWSLTSKSNLCVLAEQSGDDHVKCRYELWKLMGESFHYY